jgi:hypothetical protein
MENAPQRRRLTFVYTQDYCADMVFEIAGRLWPTENVVALVDQLAPKPGKREPQKKLATV